MFVSCCVNNSHVVVLTCLYNILQLDNADREHEHMKNSGTVGGVEVHDYDSGQGETNLIAPYHLKGHLTQPGSFPSQLAPLKQKETTMRSSDNNFLSSQSQTATSGPGFSNPDALDTAHDETNGMRRPSTYFGDPYSEYALTQHPRSLEKEDNKKLTKQNNTIITRSNRNGTASKKWTGLFHQMVHAWKKRLGSESKIRQTEETTTNYKELKAEEESRNRGCMFSTASCF